MGTQSIQAANSVACIPQFAEGFDGQTIWQTQLFLDGRTFGADQAVINVFSPQGLFLSRVGPGEFLFSGPFFRRPLFPIFGPISLFGPVSLRDLLFQPFRSGFLIVESPGALNVTAQIRRFSLTGELLSDLVISPFDPFHRANLVVEDFEARVLAFAVANADTLKRALGRFDFFPLGSPFPLLSFPFEIGPRSQFSSFLFNMFPELASGGLKGTVRISSDSPISLIAVSVDGNALKQVPIVIEE